MAPKSHVVDRTRLIEHLREHPGSRPSDMAEVLDVHPSTAEYHLRRMCREGRVIREKVGRQLHHYAAGQGLCSRARQVHARSTPAGRQVLGVALKRGVFPRQAVVGEGFSPSAVRWALKQLSKAGAIERMAWGVYRLPTGARPCVRAALTETACAGCNEGLGEPATGQERRRATSSPSPNGRIAGSRSE